MESISNLLLYEDNHLLVLNKPPGLLTCGDETGDPSLLEQAKEWIKVQYKKPGKVFLAMVHRLDRKTSGVVVFCKTSKAASRLSEQFRSHQIIKIYYALVEGKIQPPQGILEGYLQKDEENRRSQVFSDPSQKTKKSSIKYQVEKEGASLSLLKIEPEGGRFHQIRVLLSAQGYPILGDVKYGGTSYPLQGGIALHAKEITFLHPTTRDPITISTPLPEHWPGC